MNVRDLLRLLNSGVKISDKVLGTIFVLPMTHTVLLIAQGGQETLIATVIGGVIAGALLTLTERARRKAEPYAKQEEKAAAADNKAVVPIWVIAIGITSSSVAIWGLCANLLPLVLR